MTGITETGKESNRSSRISKLKVCGSLIENAIAPRGPALVYLRVKGPDGILLTNPDQGVFNAAGEQLIYSAVREIDYQGSEGNSASSRGWIYPWYVYF